MNNRKRAPNQKEANNVKNKSPLPAQTTNLKCKVAKVVNFVIVPGLNIFIIITGLGLTLDLDISIIG